MPFLVLHILFVRSLCFFFFNDTATTEIYTLSLHDALPISAKQGGRKRRHNSTFVASPLCSRDRKSTRLNSSHSQISYAVFCLKKKKTKNTYHCLSKKKNNNNQKHT